MIAHRVAEITRKTRETDIVLRLDLDGVGHSDVASGVPFLDHMLNHVVAHSLIDLTLRCTGDTHIDDHHTVEDIGIALGQALTIALGDKRSITRYGQQLLPMDESLALVALDLSGRGYLAYDVQLPTPRVGGFDTELLEEFLRALAHNGGITLHVTLLHGHNSHHIIEAVFKALGRALGQAVALDPRRGDIPSTKGVL